MEYRSYEDRASQMYEKTMENVHNRTDTAKHALEEISIIVDDIEAKMTDEQYQRLESLISKAIIALCGV